MSLAGQISRIVTTLASTREARHVALGHIRKDTARHLGDARAARRRMASEQQHRLSEALRTIRLGTAILLGEADERIDRYHKARVKQAARLDRALAEGVKSLRANTHKWIGTQSAMRRKAGAQDLRQRQQDRKALGAAGQDLATKNLAFLATLTKDRQEASGIWQGRAKSASAAARPSASGAKAETVKADVAKAETMDVQVKTAPVAAAVAKPDAANIEAVKADSPLGEAVKIAAPAGGDGKPAAAKPTGEKSSPGKSAQS